MSDIENSGGDDDSVAVSKKNGTSALKENNVAKIIPKSGLDDNKMDVDVDGHNHSGAAGNKLDGSSSPKKLPGKQHHVMNGGSSIDGDYDERTGKALTPLIQDARGMPLSKDMQSDSRSLLAQCFWITNTRADSFACPPSAGSGVFSKSRLSR